MRRRHHRLPVVMQLAETVAPLGLTLCKAPVNRQRRCVGLSLVTHNPFPIRLLVCSLDLCFLARPPGPVLGWSPVKAAFRRPGEATRGVEVFLHKDTVLKLY